MCGTSGTVLPFSVAIQRTLYSNCSLNCSLVVFVVFVLCQGAFCVTLLEAAEPAALLSSPNSAALCCNKYQLAQLPPCPQLREARAPILDCNKVQQGATAVET